MVMEYLHGKTLLQLVQERGALPETEAIGHVEKVGEALAVVHGANLIHRDIKPANIMRCDDGRIVLIDFGLIKPDMTRGYGTMHLTGGTAIGTSGYAPPEQYTQNSQLGVPADIYALGATLYHLLTGEVPVAATDRALGGADLPAPRRLKSSLSPAVNDTILRALSLKASERPQTVRAFLDALNAQPVTAPALPAKSTFTAPAAPTPSPPMPLRTAHQIAIATAPPVRTPTPPITPAAPTMPAPTATPSTQSKWNNWGWAALALAALAYWMLPERLVMGLAAVICGIISWGVERRVRWNSLLGMVAGGWLMVIAWATMARNTPPTKPRTPGNPSSATSQSRAKGPGSKKFYQLRTFNNGDRYGGEIRGGKRNGYGVYTWPNGDRYEGKWRDDKKNGQGSLTLANGDRYEGEFRDNWCNGKGVFTLANGDRYEGDFRHGKRTGRGVATQANGDRYEGEFRDNKMNGHGVFTRHGVLPWANGDRYEGEWQNDKLIKRTD